MKPREKPLRDPSQKKATDILLEFVGLFESKGWLNQSLRIKHRNRRYRLYCSKTEFVAYRINDHCGISPGIPGWPVCFITHEQIIEDSEMSEFASTEPRSLDWLRCIVEDDLELI